MAIPLVQLGESVVLVVTDGDDLVCVRQTRPGTPEATLELPAGMLEPGETPLQAASRELAEECRLAAAQVAYVGAFWVVPSYSTERSHVFHLWDLSAAAPAARDADEDIEIERVPVDAAWRTLSDAGSLAALGLWEREGR